LPFAIGQRGVVWHTPVMKTHFLSVILFALTAAPLAAQTPMTGDEFEAYSQGKTLFFRYDDDRYGAEEYLPGRRVRWSFLDGDCKNGEWYEDGQMICFVYEDNPDPQCWSVYEQGDGLMAMFENDPTQTTLFQVERTDEPMVCLGPDVGV